MKSYIIRLKDVEISNQTANDCINQAANFGILVSESDAVNGLYHREHLEFLNLKPTKKIRDGACGCILSHIYLWKKCIADNETYLILEHDGYFIEPLPEDILSKFDDILKLDNSNPYSKSYENEIERKSLLEFQVIDLENNLKFYSDAGLYSRGSYAYIIKPHAAKKLLSWIEKNGFIRSDHQLGNDICKVQTVNKTIVRLHPFYLNNVKELSLTNNIGKINGNT
jgi:GR25 family glycosyltransferase involved in LPS biosynthesis